MDEKKWIKQNNLKPNPKSNSPDDFEIMIDFCSF